MPTVLAGALAFSAATSVAGGFQANSAAKRLAQLQEQQGQLAFEESQVNATNEAFNQRQAVGNQRLAFLANGVTLEGSPSLVLNESTKYGQAQVNSILRQGKARKSLAMAEAVQTRNQGRTALISGIASGTSTLIQGSSVLGGKKVPIKEGTLG